MRRECLIRLQFYNSTAGMGLIGVAHQAVYLCYRSQGREAAPGRRAGRGCGIVISTSGNKVRSQTHHRYQQANSLYLLDILYRNLPSPFMVFI